MTRKIFLVAGLSVALLSGCATQSIEQGKDLSASGIAYSDAVDKLLDVTADRLIDFDTEELKKTRRGSDPKGMITSKNKKVRIVLTKIEKFRAQTKLLKAYFLNLQALADSPVKDDVRGAVESLSDRISKLNKALDSNDEIQKLNEDQKTQIGALGGLVANAVHASKIRRALARDAEVIGIYLVLQENQLNVIFEILEDRFLAENDLFLEQKIIAPYVDTSQTLGAGWANNRKQWLRTQFINPQLETAKEAAKQLRVIWVDILEGKSDINSLSILISDVNEFVATVQALEAAGKTK